MNPILTILLVEDMEKEPAMVARFFMGLKEMNIEAMDRAQVIAISQREYSPELEMAISAAPFPVQLVYADHPRAANGYPIWDVCAEVRQVWPLIRGEYITFAHTEFFYGPDRLTRTIEWLDRHKPVVALGNLRRLGTDKAHWRNRTQDPEPGVGDIFRELVDCGLAGPIRKTWEAFPTWHWPYWRPGVREDEKWDEDVFYARKDWFEAIKMFWHEERLPFLDVYDIVGKCMERLSRNDLQPRCRRLDMDTNMIMHIDHTRPRLAFGIDCYKWFLDRADDWADTTCMRHDIWGTMLHEGSDMKSKLQAIEHYRRAPGGPVTRWASNFSGWLQTVGADIVIEYMLEHERPEEDDEDEYGFDDDMTDDATDEVEEIEVSVG